MAHGFRLSLFFWVVISLFLAAGQSEAMAAPAFVVPTKPDPEPVAIDRCLLTAAVGISAERRRWVLERLVDFFEKTQSTLLEEARRQLASLPQVAFRKAKDDPGYWLQQAKDAEVRAHSYEARGLDSAEHWAKAAWCYHKANSLDQSKRAAGRARTLIEAETGKEKSPIARVTLARVYIAGRELETARNQLDRTELQVDHMARQVRIFHYQNIAEAWFELPDLAEAQRITDKVVALAKSAAASPDGSFTPRQVSSDLLHYGRMLVENRRVDAALALLPEMVDADRDLALEHFIEVAGYEDRCGEMRSLANKFRDFDSRIRHLVKLADRECPELAPQILVDLKTLLPSPKAPLRDITRRGLVAMFAARGQFEQARFWMDEIEDVLDKHEAQAMVAVELARRDRCEEALPMATASAEAAGGFSSSGDRYSVWVDAIVAMETCGAFEAPGLYRRTIPETELAASAIGWARRGDIEKALQVLSSFREQDRKVSEAIGILRILGPKAKSEHFQSLCPGNR